MYFHVRKMSSLDSNPVSHRYLLPNTSSMWTSLYFPAEAQEGGVVLVLLERTSSLFGINCEDSPRWEA